MTFTSQTATLLFKKEEKGISSNPLSLSAWRDPPPKKPSHQTSWSYFRNGVASDGPKKTLELTSGGSTNLYPIPGGTQWHLSRYLVVLPLHYVSWSGLGVFWGVSPSLWAKLPLTNPISTQNMRFETIFRSARTSWNTFVRSPVRPSVPRQKSKSHLQPYKSSQAHARPLIWNIAVKRTMSSIIPWWWMQKQRQIQRQRQTNFQEEWVNV